MLPAYAGMILLRKMMMSAPFGAPRVCGDDPINKKYGLDVSVCSPRMRG